MRVNHPDFAPGRDSIAFFEVGFSTDLRWTRYTCTYARAWRQSISDRTGRARAGSTTSRRMQRLMREIASSCEGGLLASGSVLEAPSGADSPDGRRELTLNGVSLSFRDARVTP